MALLDPISKSLDPISKSPTLTHNSYSATKKAYVPQERVSHSQNFANSLSKLAPHINIMDLEHGKSAVEEAATFCLESNPTFLYRVKANLLHISTKVDLQKYVYNSILRGEKLYV